MTRRTTPLPNGDLLNTYEISLLQSTKYTERRRCFQILVDKCGGSYSLAESWLFKYYPQYARTRRTLRRMSFNPEIVIKKVMDDMGLTENQVLSKEEIQLIVYLYLKKKLYKCSTEPCGTVS